MADLNITVSRQSAPVPIEHSEAFMLLIREFDQRLRDLCFTHYLLSVESNLGLYSTVYATDTIPEAFGLLCDAQRTFKEYVRNKEAG